MSVISGDIIVMSATHRHRVSGQTTPEMAYRIWREVVLISFIDSGTLETTTRERIRVAEVGTRLRMRIRAYLVLSAHIAKVRHFVHVNPHTIVVDFTVELFDLRSPVFLYKGRSEFNNQLLNQYT
jgi:fructose-bisphosphate aldolase class 1